MPTHLICDCDGVLVDSETISLEVLADPLGRHLPGRDTAAIVRPRLGQTLAGLLAEVAAEEGLSIDADEAQRIRVRVEGEIFRRLRPVHGVGEALAAIGLPKAVASNSDAVRVREALARTGLAPLFDGRIYTADRVGAAKPRPDIYLAASAGFGVPPPACVVVEDSVTGVTAAVAAGMRVIGFAGAGHVGPDHAAQLRAAGAGDIFHDMRALPALIERMRAEAGARASI